MPKTPEEMLELYDKSKNKPLTKRYIWKYQFERAAVGWSPDAAKKLIEASEIMREAIKTIESYQEFYHTDTGTIQVNIMKKFRSRINA